MAETPGIRRRVLVEEARRRIDECIHDGDALGRQLVADRAQLGVAASDLGAWMRQAAATLKELLTPDSVAAPFESSVPVADPQEPLNVSVSRLQALRAERLRDLAHIRESLATYPGPQRFRWPRLSQDRIANDLVSGVLLAGILAVAGLALAGRFGSPSPTDQPGSTSGGLSSTEPPADSVGPGSAGLPTDARPSVVITPTASPATGLVYSADWSSGTNGWSVSSAWSVIGGHAYRTDATSHKEGEAPEFFPLYSLPPGDITVVATVRLLRYSTVMGVWRAFGLSVRSEAEGAYAFGVCSLCLDGESSIGLSIKGISRPIKAEPFDPGTEWHEYRVEFRGARVVCYVDDVEVFNEVETTFLTGTGVGLWASGAALEVSGFEVTRP